MLFASTELAARIERAECALIADSVAAAARRRDLDVLSLPVAGGQACAAGPGSPLNKIVGAGFGPLPADAVWAEIEAAYDARGLPVQAEVSVLADPELAATLTGRGYRLVNCENVLGRSLANLPPLPRVAGLVVEQCGPDDTAAWLGVIVAGFAAPDQQGVVSHEEFPREIISDVLADMSDVVGFTTYLVRRAGESAGAGGLRLRDGVAHLCGAATLPAHRRLGAQTLLLAARLHVAAEAGCDLAVVTTQPGSKSQQNVQRQGFELLYTRNVLVRGHS